MGTRIQPAAGGRGGLLKSDLFGEVRLLEGVGGAVVLRDTRGARPWVAGLARALARREARALRHLAGLPGTPRLLGFDGRALEREWIAGEPMQRVRPCDAAYYREALALLRRLHRAGVTHNDLAKETNWLVTAGGRPALVDFQLAVVHGRRGQLFRTLAREDLRHLLKHKRTYRPAALTARQRRILASPSLASRLWRTTGKRAYLFVTRRLLGWADREGAGDRELARGLGAGPPVALSLRPAPSAEHRAMGICHEHNLSRPVASSKPFGVRVSLRPGDPFASLVGSDWSREHWYHSERERDEALAEMSRRYPFFRIGDEPALVFERLERDT